jgi:hypothetical protein
MRQRPSRQGLSSNAPGYWNRLSLTDLGWEEESLSQCRPMLPVETQTSGECIARNNLDKTERDQGQVVYVFRTESSKELAAKTEARFCLF